MQRYKDVIWAITLSFSLTGFSLTGCAVKIPGAMDPIGSQMMNAVDAPVSAVTPDQAQSLIILTLNQQEHDRLTKGAPIREFPSKGISGSNGVIPAAYRAFLNEMSLQYGLERVADWPLESLGARCLVFETPGETSRAGIVDTLSRDPRIDIAQPLNMFQTLGETYNDPYFDLQSGLQAMQISQAHQWATGKGIRIAVVDTGMDITHPEVRDRVELSRNFVDSNSIAFQNDLHGTAIGAAIAAPANNGIGLVGVSPESRLVALKACWQKEPEFSKAVCSSFTLAKSIDFAVSQGVDIINLSLGGPRDPLLEALVKNAIDKSIIVVGAIGSQPNQFPTALEHVIAVADTKTEFIGELLMAPGKKIISARPHSEYDFYSGSSMSTAQVSGVVALLRERKPHMTPNDMRGLLMATSQKMRDISLPSGPVNACRALAQLVGSDQC